MICTVQPMFPVRTVSVFPLSVMRALISFSTSFMPFSTAVPRIKQAGITTNEDHRRYARELEKVRS